MDHNLTHRIRERAYQIWLANGCRDGEAEQHWLTAEHEIIQAAAAVKLAKGTISKKAGRPLGRSAHKATAPVAS